MKVKIPDGYRRLRKGEIVRAGDLFTAWQNVVEVDGDVSNLVGNGWITTSCVGHKVGINECYIRLKNNKSKKT
jgi:hypothetical protein